MTTMRAVTLVLLFSAFFAIANAAYRPPHPHDHEKVYELWTNFKKTHNRNYTQEGELKGLICFIENLGRIEELNENSKTAKFGITIFADQCLSEFRKTHGGFKKPDLGKINGTTQIRPEDHPWKKMAKKSATGDKVLEPSSPPPSPPSFLDYRTWGVLREPVRAEGSCGASCYFSTVVATEAAVSLWLDYNITLSPQELIDCTQFYPYDNEGCNGGLMEVNFNYMRDNGGIASEAQYPYAATTHGSCTSISNKPIGISTWGFFLPYESALVQGVSAGGPATIALAGLYDANFMLYESGVLDNCASQSPDTALAIVGYNLAASTPYWIVRNSWGPTWGVDGYMYLAYGTNECGILEYPGMQPIVEFN